MYLPGVTQRSRTGRMSVLRDSLQVLACGWCGLAGQTVGKGRLESSGARELMLRPRLCSRSLLTDRTRSTPVTYDDFPFSKSSD